MHEVVGELSAMELVAASGGDWGGTKVDESFEDLVKDLVGSRVYSAFKTQHTEDWLELMRDFELKKKTIRPENEGQITLTFPMSLFMLSKQVNGKDLEKSISTSTKYSKSVECTNNKIRFKNSIFKKLFERSCENVVAHVKNIIHRLYLHDLKVIVMVGGYSESLMLQHYITKNFPQIKIVIPIEANTAILKGALIYGHKPELITKRVLKYTYGVVARIPFDPRKHPPSRRIVIDKEHLCENAFDKHVEKGEIVTVGEAQIQKSYLAFSGLSKVNILLYASECKDPQYVDELGCTQIGVLSIDMDPFAVNREILVSFTFSGTEIFVEAYVKKTGEKKKVSIDFLG